MLKKCHIEEKRVSSSEPSLEVDSAAVSRVDLLTSVLLQEKQANGDHVVIVVANDVKMGPAGVGHCD